MIVQWIQSGAVAGSWQVYAGDYYHGDGALILTLSPCSTLNGTRYQLKCLRQVVKVPCADIDAAKVWASKWLEMTLNGIVGNVRELRCSTITADMAS